MIKFYFISFLFIILISCSENPAVEDTSPEFSPIEITPYEGNLEYPTSFRRLSVFEISERQKQFETESEFQINGTIDSLGFLKYHWHENDIRERSSEPIENISLLFKKVKYDIVRLHKFTGVIDTTELITKDINYYFIDDSHESQNRPNMLQIIFEDSHYSDCELNRYLVVKADNLGIYQIYGRWYRYVAIPEQYIFTEGEARNKILGMKLDYDGDYSDRLLNITEDILNVENDKIIYPVYTESKLELRTCYKILVYDEELHIFGWEFYIDTQTGEIQAGFQLPLFN